MNDNIKDNILKIYHYIFPFILLLFIGISFYTCNYDIFAQEQTGTDDRILPPTQELFNDKLTALQKSIINDILVLNDMNNIIVYYDTRTNELYSTKSFSYDITGNYINLSMQNVKKALNETTYVGNLNISFKIDGDDGFVLFWLKKDNITKFDLTRYLKVINVTLTSNINNITFIPNGIYINKPIKSLANSVIDLRYNISTPYYVDNIKSNIGKSYHSNNYVRLYLGNEDTDYTFNAYYQDTKGLCPFIDGDTRPGCREALTNPQLQWLYKNAKDYNDDNNGVIVLDENGNLYAQKNATIINDNNKTLKTSLAPTIYVDKQGIVKTTETYINIKGTDTNGNLRQLYVYQYVNMITGTDYDPYKIGVYRALVPINIQPVMDGKNMDYGLNVERENITSPGEPIIIMDANKLYLQAQQGFLALNHDTDEWTKEKMLFLDIPRAKTDHTYILFAGKPRGYIKQIKPSDEKIEVNLPQPNINNNVSIDNSINININNNISHGMTGGYVQLIRTDYYDLYTCHKTMLSPQGFLNPNKQEYYQYITNNSSNAPNSADYILMPVYSHTKIDVYAPNMTISQSQLGFKNGYYDYNGNILDKYIYATGKGILQRDVNKFNIEYVDETLKKEFSYANLPITNSVVNDVKLELHGQKGVSATYTGESYNLHYSFKIGSKNHEYYFAVTDTQSHVNVVNNYINQNQLTQSQIEASQQNTNILQQAISKFQHALDNLIQHGNNKTQQAQQQNQQVQNQLDNVINKHESLENQHIQNMNDSLNNIDVNKNDISKNPSFIESAKFVKLNFDKLTQDNPIGQLLTFSLIVGLALLVIAKKL